MRPQKIKDRELLDRLFDAIRARGYDGTSMGELEELTGLKKASLYHRFPGGKKDMVRAVLEDVDIWSQKHIVGVLESPSMEADLKLETVLANLNVLYQKGRKTCIYRALSLQSGMEHFREELLFGIKSWIDAFTSFGIDMGLTALVARKKATQTVSLIQGGLMVSRIMENKTIWKQTLQQVRELYEY